MKLGYGLRMGGRKPAVDGTSRLEVAYLRRTARATSKLGCSGAIRDIELQNGKDGDVSVPTRLPIRVNQRNPCA